MGKRKGSTVERIRDMQRMQAAHGDDGSAATGSPLPRPKTRADCASVPRPCPYAGCRYNLALDVLKNGSIQWTRGEDWDAPGQPLTSCALDAVASGPVATSEMSEILNLDIKTLRHIEAAARKRLGARLKVLKD